MRTKIMNSVILKLGLESIVLIATIVSAIINYRRDKKGLMLVSILIAAATFGSSFIINDVPKPHIDRQADYSAVVLSVDGSFPIEYKISTDETSGDEWIKYEKPFKLKKSGMIYARAKTLWYKSEIEYRAVYLSENGLVFFSSAEEPSDSISTISAKYAYKDPVDGKAGNHYEGYEIKKADIQVTGLNLRGDEVELQDFSYSPKTLKSGKNTINVEYSIADDLTISCNLYVNADKPALIKLTAKYTGKNVFLGTKLDSNSFIVKGTYEDGTQKEITGFSVSSDELKAGKNQIMISKDGLSDTVELTAIDRETITENEIEPNNDLKKANDIDVNVKYSGTIIENDDVDYYRIYLNEKGKIALKLTHPKIDDDKVFWRVSLFSQEENEIIGLNASGKNVDTISSSARVPAGVYYIKVSKDYHSTEKYTISVAFETEDDSYEDEPNDNLSSQAMNIQLDKTYTGNLTTTQDVDYYTFSLSEKRKIWINYSHQKTSTTNTLWDVSLSGDSAGTILEFESTGENANITSRSVRLPPGNYYMKVSAYSWSDIDYSFCINSRKEGAETENEDNNDYGSATKIELGSSITGNIQSERDVDFYRIDIKSTRSISISFAHNQIDSGSSFWCLELYSDKSSNAIKNTENRSTLYIQGDDPNLISSQWSSLPAGIYYIKVYKNNYCNDDYTITISG